MQGAVSADGQDFAVALGSGIVCKSCGMALMVGHGRNEGDAQFLHSLLGGHPKRHSLTRTCAGIDYYKPFSFRLNHSAKVRIISYFCILWVK